MKPITTVNYHFTRKCNFKCSYCFAHFDNKKELYYEEQKELIKQIAACGYFDKINFAGGEPMMDKNLSQHLQLSKELGLQTSIITNGSLLKPEWIKENAQYVDIIGISIDSINKDTNKQIGRNTKLDNTFMNNIKLIHEYGIGLKINTTVNTFNKNEILTSFINEIKPFRWKILQTTKIEGENSENYNKVCVTKEAFELFYNNNRKELLPEIKIITELSDDMTSSYCMIDPSGRFYNNAHHKLSYSEPILQIGIEKAYNMMEYKYDKFEDRGGIYNI